MLSRHTLRYLVPTFALCATTYGAEFVPVTVTPSSDTAPAPKIAPQPVPKPVSKTDTAPAATAGTSPATTANLTAANAEPLIVTATRLDIDFKLQPYAIHQSSQVELSQTNARTVTDAVNYTPGVYVQRTAPNQASPYIRGLTGEQTLLLFNGVRLNHAMMRPGPNQYAAMIPGMSVERIDTILGSSSTVMGSDGLTGAMDFRLAEAGRDADTAIRPFAATRYGTADGASANAGIDGRANGFAYTMEASHEEYKELRGGNEAGDHLYGDAAGQNRIPNSDYRQYALAGRVAYEGLDNHHFELNTGFTRQSDAPRPDGYFENSAVDSRISRYYNPEDFTYIHARHAARYDGPIETVQTTLWWHNHYEDQTREDIQGSGATARYRERVYQDEINTLGLDLQLGSHIGDAHSLTYGTTLYTEVTANDFQRTRAPAGNTNPGSAIEDQTGTANPGETTVPDDSTYTGIGIFVQDDWAFAERWNLLGGLRFSQSAWKFTATDDRPGFNDIAPGTTTAAQEFSDSTGAATGSVRLGWAATDTLYGFTGLSQGFRTPTLSDLAGRQDRGSSSSGTATGPQIQGNPSLDSEKSLTAELGSRWFDEADTASITVFYTALRDLIQVAYTDVNNDTIIDQNDTAQSVNADDGYVTGFEVANDYGLPTFGTLSSEYRLAFMQTFSLVQGRADVPQPTATASSDWQNISRANMIFGKAGLRLGHESGWWGMAQVRYQAGYNDVAPTDGSDTRQTTFPAKGGDPGAMPGFGVMDLLAGYRSPTKGYYGTASIENIFDRTYRMVGSGTDGAGFNIVLSLGAVF